MLNDFSAPIPPHFFKLVSLENLDFNKKIVKIDVPDWHINLMADGYVINVCASRNIPEQLGLLSSSIRCTSCAAVGAIKRISTSKSRNVPQILKFLPALCTAMCHFQLAENV